MIDIERGYKNHDLKVGGPVEYIYGWPGPDVTFGIVTRIDEKTFDFYDLCFDMELKNKSREPIFSEREPEGYYGYWVPTDEYVNTQSAGFSTSTRTGNFTYRQLMDEYLEKYKL